MGRQLINVTTEEIEEARKVLKLCKRGDLAILERDHPLTNESDFTFKQKKGLILGIQILDKIILSSKMIGINKSLHKFATFLDSLEENEREEDRFNLRALLTILYPHHFNFRDEIDIRVDQEGYTEKYIP